MVITSASHAAVAPAGRFTGAPIPVAKVVAWVIFTKAVLKHKLGVEDATPAVMSAVTVIVPVALTVPQPPVKGML